MPGPPYGKGPPWAPGGISPPGIPPDAPKIAAPQPLTPPYVGNTSWSVTSVGLASFPFGVNANFGDGVVIAVFHTLTRTIRFSDNFGSTYCPAGNQELSNAGNTVTSLFYCPNLLGTNPTVTIFGNGNLGSTVIGWLQIVGANPGWFVDAVNNIPISTTNLFKPFVVTSAPNDLIVSILSGNSTAQPTFGTFNVLDLGRFAPVGPRALIAYSQTPQPIGTTGPAWVTTGGNNCLAATLAIRTLNQFPEHAPLKGTKLPILPPWMRPSPPPFSTEIPVPIIAATPGAFTWAALDSQLFPAAITATVGAYSWSGTNSGAPTQVNSDGASNGWIWAGITATITAPPPVVTPPAEKPAGRRVRFRNIYRVSIDGQKFEFASLAAALAFLAKAKAAAEELAQAAVKEATDAKPVTLKVPEIGISSRELRKAAAETKRDIKVIYERAERDMEISLLMALKVKEDNDDDDSLMLLM